MSEKGKQKLKEYGKQYRKNMSEEDNKKKKEGVLERIQKSSNLLKKIKENNKLKTIQVDVVNNFVNRWSGRFFWCWSLYW